MNSSSFIGNDKPDYVRQMRYFHNLYGQFQFNEKFALIAGFDIGAEQKSKGKSDYNTWYSPVLIAKYSPTDKISLTARGEYYNDRNGVSVASGTENGFQTFGVSFNIDYQILPNLVWRTEVKNLNSNDAIFLYSDDDIKKGNMMAITSLAVQF